MGERVNETLMRVLEEFAAFLDLNGEDEVRPEVADWGANDFGDW